MDWVQMDRPSQRKPDGTIVSMMKDENRYELTVGDHSRSGEQWDIWEATYSPVGSDGYPKRLWNKQTGAIDKSVAEQWRKFDLLNILKTNWATLGPRVANKINIYIGDMDSYYLNNAVAIVPTDYDNRRDVDLLVVPDHAQPLLYRNMCIQTVWPSARAKRV